MGFAETPIPGMLLPAAGGKTSVHPAGDELRADPIRIRLGKPVVETRSAVRI